MKRLMAAVMVIMMVFMAMGLTACVSKGADGAEAEGQAEEPSKEEAAEDPSEAKEASEEVQGDGEEPAEKEVGQEETQAEEATEEAAKEEGEPEGESEPADEQGENVAAGSNVIVVYFSATGTTKGVAEKIAEITGGDTYEIKAAQEYTSDDLNWNDANSRTTHEQDDPEARPEIGSDSIDLAGYDTVYIGYPIWWGIAPRIMDTFVESQDFNGKNVIPFCTSGSSGIGNSGKNLAETAGSGNWISGQRFSGSVTEEELASWIEGLQG